MAGTDKTPGLTLRQRAQKQAELLYAARKEWCLIIGTVLVPSFQFAARGKVEGYINSEYTGGGIGRTAPAEDPPAETPPNPDAEVQPGPDPAKQPAPDALPEPDPATGADSDSSGAAQREDEKAPQGGDAPTRQRAGLFSIPEWQNGVIVVTIWEELAHALGSIPAENGSLVWFALLALVVLAVLWAVKRRKAK